MRILKKIGGLIRNFMILFSFIVNIVLLVIVIALGILIFDIKNNVVTPLITGLHSSFVGLNDATIDWTIPVRDEIPVVLDIPLQTETIVTLTQNVPLTLNAQIDLGGGNTLDNATVFLSLPAGTELPVRLDLNVPVDQMLDVSLDVRAVIPLSETQLHDPVDNLRLTFEPIVRALYNLPNGFDGVLPFANDVLDGSPPNLLAENDYSLQPWPGYSRTAGLNYGLFGESWPAQNLPMQTGIVAEGGIPALDEQLRPEIYAAGGPDVINQQAEQSLQAQGVPAPAYDGTMAAYVVSMRGTTGTEGGSIPPSEGSGDLGIVVQPQTAAPLAENVLPVPDNNPPQESAVPPTAPESAPQVESQSAPPDVGSGDMGIIAGTSSPHDDSPKGLG